MKHIKLPTTIFMAGSLFFLSCNSGNEKESKSVQDSTATDTTIAKTETITPSITIADVMTIRHKVADYAKWKASYDGHESVREGSGLHNFIIVRGTEDSNMVMVVLRMDDVAKAKQFAASPDLKTRMMKAGVAGPAYIDYEKNIISIAADAQEPIRLMVKHKVKDFDAWKKVFDDDKQARMDAGLTDRVIAHTVGDDHNVTIIFSVADMAKAKAFINSQDLKDKMKAGGVEGSPTFFFYRVAEKY